VEISNPTGAAVENSSDQGFFSMKLRRDSFLGNELTSAGDRLNQQDPALHANVAPITEM
jgi:hypothetical protein